MGTKFTAIYNRFLGKITDDMYMELTPQDTLRDMQHLLLDALPGFEFPRQNLYDYTIRVDQISEADVQPDDFVIGTVWNDLNEEGKDIPDVLIENSVFAADLNSEEINILALLMMRNWLQRQVTSIENIRMKYSGSDFKMTSQANHLAKLLTLQDECRRQSHHMQRLYKRRKFDSDGRYMSNWSCLRISAIDD